MWKILGIISVMVIAIVVAIMPCRADEQFSDSDLRVFEGNVVNVDTAGSILTVKGVIQLDFPISSDTKFSKEASNMQQEDIRFSDISIGDYVTVQYYRSGSESRVPAKVVMVTVEYGTSR